MNFRMPVVISDFLSKKVVSIDIGSYETKVVEGKQTSKGIVVDKYFSFFTPEGIYENGYIKDKELLYHLLKDELKKNKVTSDIVYITVKSSLIITREIILPNLGEEEINGILKYQLDGYIPVDPEDFVVQYIPIGKIEEEGDTKLNILLIAIPKQIVESHYELLKDLELKPFILDFQSNGITKLLNYNSLINGRYSTEDLTVAIIDLGFDNTNVTITKNGAMQVSRTIETGGNDLNTNILNFFEYTKSQVEEKKRNIENIAKLEDEYTDENRFVNIVKTSIKGIMDKIDTIFRYYYSREKGNDVKLILLNGGLSNIDGIDSLFSNYYNIPTVRIERLDKIFFSEDLNKYINCIGSLIRIEEQ